jgi:hypothetical protein
MGSNIKGIEHGGITVSALEAVERFFHEAFGAEMLSTRRSRRAAKARTALTCTPRTGWSPAPASSQCE